jgi:hypothetical protein
MYAIENHRYLFTDNNYRQKNDLGYGRNKTIQLSNTKRKVYAGGKFQLELQMQLFLGPPSSNTQPAQIWKTRSVSLSR